jgi:hypothetical protein
MPYPHAESLRPLRGAQTGNRGWTAAGVQNFLARSPFQRAMIAAARRPGLGVLVAVLLAAAVPGAAAAAPPPNDQRTQPQLLTLPSSVTGTTGESTLEADEPSGCAPLAGSVFYEVRAPSADRITVRLDAAGDLDATLDVFRRVRSQLELVNCDTTDRRGQTGFQFRPQPRGVYLIRVAQRAGSVAGSFRLDVFAPVPPPRPPGAALRPSGVTRSLDSLQDTSDAWSFRMRAGVSYRINLAAGPCMSLRIYSPGTRDFESDPPVRSAGCDGYLLFTPAAGEGGRYSLVVNARPNRRGAQRYHLQAARAGSDDTTPGLPLPNHRRMRGSLAGAAVDAVDLYRFSLTRRSVLELTLRHQARGTMTLALLTDRGRALAGGGTEISQQVRAGRYYVAVRTRDQATGRYTLRRVARAITRTSVTIDGRRSAKADPGHAARIGAGVAPGASGPVMFTIERFDPIAGWQFHDRIQATARGGRAEIPFPPPFVGRWRARASFEGTRDFAPSESGYASLLVAAPPET